AHSGITDTDPSFGTNGTVQVCFEIGLDEGSGCYANPASFVLQADGKLLVGHQQFLIGHGTSSSLAQVLRRRPDGASDASFTAGGVTPARLMASDWGTIGTAVAVQPDGKLLFAARDDFFPGQLPCLHCPSNLALARFNGDGTLDPSFGTGGIVRV